MPTNLDSPDARQERNAKSGREDPWETSNHGLPADNDSGPRAWRSGLRGTLGENVMPVCLIELVQFVGYTRTGQRDGAGLVLAVVPWRQSRVYRNNMSAVWQTIQGHQRTSASWLLRCGWQLLPLGQFMPRPHLRQWLELPLPSLLCIRRP